MVNPNKKKNYKNEKTDAERKRRSIKRMTREKYPLKYYDDAYGYTIHKKCFFCPSNAEERHHTTRPIKVDEFIFTCKSCHRKLHKLLKKLGIWNYENNDKGELRKN